MERWLPVLGYEGHYEVSDLGRVRSVGRWVRSKADSRQWRPGQLLRPHPARAGYHQVCLSRDGELWWPMVAALVLEAHDRPRPEGMEALHGPAGKADNSLANLHWGTHAENCADKRRDGTWQGGERNPIAKLTETTVRECRRRYAEGERAVDLAREFGVHKTTLHRALNGTRWGHVTERAA